MSEKTINRAYEAQVKQILFEWMGQDFVELVPNRSHPDSIVYTGIGRKESFVFKMMDPDGKDADRIAAEAWALTKARSVGVPAPSVVKMDASKSVLPTTYMVMEQVQGGDLRTPQLYDEEMRPYLLKIGRMLRRLHTATVEGHGFLQSDGDSVVRGEADSWKSAALGAFADGLRVLQDNNLITPERVVLAEKIITQHDHLLTPNYNSLLHGDVGMIHVFADLQTEALTGLIDFGECKSGDPVWDIVDIRGRYVPTIIEGYEPDAEMQETFQDRFAIYGILRNMIWALRWYDVWPDSVAGTFRYFIDNAANHFKLI